MVVARILSPFFKKAGVGEKMKSYCEVKVTSFANLSLFKNNILQSLFYKTVYLPLKSYLCCFLDIITW